MESNMTHASKYINRQTKTITATLKVVLKGTMNNLQQGIITPYNLCFEDIRLEWRAGWTKLIKYDGYRLLFRYEGKEYLIIYNK